jgi:tellurite resistance protein TehA-like permease
LHDDKEAAAGSVTLKDRLKHSTFAWYACTISTGGVAFVLSVIPSRFDGLTQWGTGIFLFNLFLFTVVTITMCARFYVYPGTFTHSMTNPHEGCFFATFWLSLATMIINTTAYGIPNSGPWLLVALRYAFWAYTVCATLLAIFYYHVLFQVKKLVVTNVLPGWVLPIFPAMLVGTTQQPTKQCSFSSLDFPIRVLASFVALMMYGIYFGRLLTSGLPIDMSRPAMFIAFGPTSFTALAFIGMAQDVTATQIFSVYTSLNGVINQDIILDILLLFALLMAIFLWTLAFWFFAITFVASMEAVTRNDFHLNWSHMYSPTLALLLPRSRSVKDLIAMGSRVWKLEWLPCCSSCGL